MNWRIGKWGKRLKVKVTLYTVCFILCPNTYVTCEWSKLGELGGVEWSGKIIIEGKIIKWSKALLKIGI